MEPMTRRDIIETYEASRAKVFVYMAEALTWARRREGR